MTPFKAGDRVAKLKDHRIRGNVVRKHEVEGAWYVRWDSRGLNDGVYDYNLVLISPFEDSVYAYVQKELLE